MCTPASSSPWSALRVAGRARLLRIAAGLTRATVGFVSIDRTSLGYVFQDATLLQWRNVQRNVELLAELEGMSASDRRRRADDAIQLVGLTGFEKKYPKQLSGGMKMRASLARSLVLEPKVFLFDEPFGAVDEITRERLNDEVHRTVPAEGLRRPVHHPLDQRGGVLVDQGAGDERRDLVASSVTSRFPSTTHAGPNCASTRHSPSSVARCRPTCEEESTREHHHCQPVLLGQRSAARQSTISEHCHNRRSASDWR